MTFLKNEYVKTLFYHYCDQYAIGMILIDRVVRLLEVMTSRWRCGGLNGSNQAKCRKRVRQRKQCMQRPEEGQNVTCLKN